MLVSSAAMPPFNEVDEMQHVDLIHKFARGYWPSADPEHTDPEVAYWRVLYGSFEFDRGPNDSFPPPCGRYPTARGGRRSSTTTCEQINSYNHEAHSLPAYYAVAACWYQLGRLFGLRNAHAFYWMRFLNVPVFVGLILVAYRFAEAYLPARQVPPSWYSWPPSQAGRL